MSTSSNQLARTCAAAKQKSEAEYAASGCNVNIRSYCFSNTKALLIA